MSDTAHQISLAPLWLSGSVRRWHCNPALANTHQTNADHQGRCVLLLLALHPAPSVDLIRAVASHDVGEMMVGDLPGPFKHEFPALAATHAQIERDRREQITGWPQELSAADAAWLALVDQLDAHCWCLTAAPLEYRRWSAGWTLAAHDLLRRAETLGCRQAVEEILIDLQPGADQ